MLGMEHSYINIFINQRGEYSMARGVNYWDNALINKDKKDLIMETKQCRLCQQVLCMRVKSKICSDCQHYKDNYTPTEVLNKLLGINLEFQWWERIV